MSFSSFCTLDAPILSAVCPVFLFPDRDALFQACRSATRRLRMRSAVRGGRRATATLPRPRAPAEAVNDQALDQRPALRAAASKPANSLAPFLRRRRKCNLPFRDPGHAPGHTQKQHDGPSLRRLGSLQQCRGVNRFVGELDHGKFTRRSRAEYKRSLRFQTRVVVGTYSASIANIECGNSGASAGNCSTIRWRNALMVAPTGKSMAISSWPANIASCRK